MIEEPLGLEPFSADVSPRTLRELSLHTPTQGAHSYTPEEVSIMTSNSCTQQIQLHKIDITYLGVDKSHHSLDLDIPL